MKPGVYKCTGKDCPYQTIIMVERSEKELRCPKCKSVLNIKESKLGFPKS